MYRVHVSRTGVNIFVLILNPEQDIWYVDCDLQYTTLAVSIIVNDNISSAHVNANLLSIICEKLSTLLIDWSKFNAFQLCVFELFAFRGSFTQSRTYAIFTSGWFLISTNSLCLRGFLVVNWYDFYADYLKGSRP